MKSSLTGSAELLNISAEPVASGEAELWREGVGPDAMWGGEMVSRDDVPATSLAAENSALREMGAT